MPFPSAISLPQNITDWQVPGMWAWTSLGHCCLPTIGSLSHACFHLWAHMLAVLLPGILFPWIITQLITQQGLAQASPDPISLSDQPIKETFPITLFFNPLTCFLFSFSNHRLTKYICLSIICLPLLRPLGAGTLIYSLLDLHYLDQFLVLGKMFNKYLLNHQKKPQRPDCINHVWAKNVSPLTLNLPKELFFF